MQTKPSKTTIILLTAGCFIAFFLFGFTDNLKGPTLPALLAELHFDFGVGGNILLGEYLGFLIATLITGILADKYGLKTVMLMAGVALVIGVSGYSQFDSSFLLWVSLFIVGMGLGTLELGPNAIIVSLHHERKGMFLNLMSVLHGLGSMLAPLFVGWLFELDLSWRTVYRWDLPLIAVFILIFLFLRFPKSEEKTQLEFREIPHIAFKGKLPLFHVAIAAYVSAEIGMAAWLVTFLQQARGQGVVASNQGLSIFFGLVMLGRFIGSFVVHRVGYLRSILIATLGAIASVVIGLFGTGNWVFFLPITGFFLSIIFPTITAAASDLRTEKVNTVLGVLFTFAGLGGLLGPWLIGLASNKLGLQAGFSANIAFLVVLLIAVALLMRQNQHEPANPIID
jgi:MFS transporter, FHS family, glucose/mannose:H+ symporter